MYRYFATTRHKNNDNNDDDDGDVEDDDGDDDGDDDDGDNDDGTSQTLANGFSSPRFAIRDSLDSTKSFFFCHLNRRLWEKRLGKNEIEKLWPILNAFVVVMDPMISGNICG